LNFQVVSIDPRQLDDRQYFIALLEHISWRKGARTGRTVLKPIAR
jgi:hypothetical protein